MPPRSHARYALDLIQKPAAWGCAITSIGTTAVFSDVAAIAVAGVAVAATWVSASHPALRRSLDRARAREALRQQRDARETRVEDEDLTGDVRDTLDELTELVDRYVPEHEELLDLYVELSSTRRRLLAFIATVPATYANRDSTLGMAVVRHRTDHVAQCRERSRAIERQLLTIQQRIHAAAASARKRDS